MKIAAYLELLQNPQNISTSKTFDLKEVLNNFPYFQSARALYLKGLKQQESIHYNQQLKKTAAYTTDRSVLFDFITSETFISHNNELEKTFISEINVIDAQVVKELHKEIDKQTITKKLKTAEDAQKILNINEPLSFNSHEAYSFNQWLQLSTQKPIDRTISKKITKSDLIDSFIEKKPKISPLKKTEKNTSLTLHDKNIDDALMTETLAKVYVAQKKYENAITAYRILCLKYPEKSGFFADRIKAIELLQKNKS